MVGVHQTACGHSVLSGWLYWRLDAGLDICGVDDGSEITINAGHAYRSAPGHDEWVLGGEPVLGIEFSTDDSKDFAAWTRG